MQEDIQQMVTKTLNEVVPDFSYDMILSTMLGVPKYKLMTPIFNYKTMEITPIYEAESELNVKDPQKEVAANATDDNEIFAPIENAQASPTLNLLANENSIDADDNAYWISEEDLPTISHEEFVIFDTSDDNAMPSESLFRSFRLHEVVDIMKKFPTMNIQLYSTLYSENIEFIPDSGSRRLTNGDEEIVTYIGYSIKKDIEALINDSESMSTFSDDIDDYFKAVVTLTPEGENLRDTDKVIYYCTMCNVYMGKQIVQSHCLDFTHMWKKQNDYFAMIRTPVDAMKAVSTCIHY